MIEGVELNGFPVEFRNEEEQAWKKERKSSVVEAPEVKARYYNI